MKTKEDLLNDAAALPSNSRCLQEFHKIFKNDHCGGAQEFGPGDWVRLVSRDRCLVYVKCWLHNLCLYG